MDDALRFLPNRVTVSVGKRIVWRNVGSVAHTITTIRAKASRPADALVPSGTKPWDSGFVFGRETYSRAFQVPGTYRYFCVPHEGARMVGTIVVTSQS
jgi:plastocyanin